VLSAGSQRSAVFDELSVRVRKMNAEGNPVERSLEFIQSRQPDLVVLATNARDGFPRWLEPSRASAIARRSSANTLFVPSGCRSIVSPATGHLDLKRILVPVAASPDASASLVYATRAASSLGDPPVEIELLHVGGDAIPEVVRPMGEDWHWCERTTPGEVVDEILRAAQEADLVVMPSDGRNGFLDFVRGSHIERVVRGASCPVLSIPAEPPDSRTP
jgi:nucleotide-binding universal stress UspA family protein